jgi:hypothetical protein
MKPTPMTPFALVCTILVLSGCAMTQKPASVSDSATDMPVVAPPPKAAAPVVYGDPAPVGSATVVPSGLGLDKLPLIARTRQKNPAGLKQFAGQNLHGQAKFVKTAKGNPNAVVADARVGGLGEVSIWCRNVLGAMPPTRTVGFDGVMTGEIYTSEDFSHDVYLKDCRFRD